MKGFINGRYRVKLLNNGCNPDLMNKTPLAMHIVGIKVDKSWGNGPPVFLGDLGILYLAILPTW